MSNTLANPGNPDEGYDIVGAAGIWDKMPACFDEAINNEALDAMEAFGMPEDEGPYSGEITTEELERVEALFDELTRMPPYPYLRLLHNTSPPHIHSPEYKFVAVLTTEPIEPFMPVDEQAADDGLHLTVEVNHRVIVEDTPVGHDPVTYDPAIENIPSAPTKTIRALLYRGIQPIGFHPPVIEALNSFIRVRGVDWNPQSLTDIAGMDKDFYHFETIVPADEVSLTLNGETHTTTPSALVAAGLRAALCETVRVARTAPMVRALNENPELLAQYQQAALGGDPNPWRAALEATASPQQLER